MEQEFTRGQRPGKKGYGGYTLQEIADTLGITREAVRKIEDRAILKMKRYMYKKKKTNPFLYEMLEYENKLNH